MTTQIKPPKAVQKYMQETEETEQDVKAYILRQLEYYQSITDKANSTPEQWLGFKLGCTTSSAGTAIRWAKGTATARKSNRIGWIGPVR